MITAWTGFHHVSNHSTIWNFTSQLIQEYHKRNKKRHNNSLIFKYLLKNTLEKSATWEAIAI